MSAAPEKTDDLVNRILDLSENRFVNVINTQDIVENQKNPTTKRMTDCHCRLLSNWLRSKNELRRIECIEPEKLNTYLAEFFLSVRKADENLPLDDPGRQYEPGTLLSMHSSFHRHLNLKEYGHNIKTSSLFRHSRDVLMAKMKELKSLGKGNKSRASQPFSEHELKICAENNLIGTGMFSIYKYVNSVIPCIIDNYIYL